MIIKRKWLWLNLFIGFVLTFTVYADGTYQNQINLSAGTSFRGDGFERDFMAFDFAYSQPNTFFRRDAKRNIHLSRYQGTNSDGIEEEINLFGLSQDVLFGALNGYFVVGLGAFISSDDTNRIGSKFFFRERIGVGATYHAFNVELFAMHYSNGTLQTPNSGENFAMVSVGYRY